MGNEKQILLLLALTKEGAVLQARFNIKLTEKNSYFELKKLLQQMHHVRAEIKINCFAE